MDSADESTFTATRDRLLPRRQSTLGVIGALLLLVIATVLAIIQSPYPDAEGYPRRPWRDALINPIEINPPSRLTKITGNPRSIAFAGDGKTGFAVGDGGLILETDNGGLDWRVGRQTSNLTLYQIAAAKSGMAAIAVGNNDAVLMRRAASSKWEPVLSAPPGEYYAAHISADGTTVWAVGAMGLAVRSSDMGKSWANMPIPAEGDLRAIAFSEGGSTGWAGGDDGLLYETTDGGASWLARGPGNGSPAVRAEPGSRPEIEAGTAAINMASLDLEGDGHADPGRFVTLAAYAPANGRPAFQLAGQLTDRTTPTALAEAERFAFLDPSGAIRPIQRTLRRPRPPTVKRAPPKVIAAVPVAAPEIISALTAIPGRNAVAGVVAQQLFVGSLASGRKDIGPVSSVSMGNATTGMAVGGGKIFRTNDGGANWQRQSSSSGTAPSVVHAHSDGKRAWAVGADGSILATRDGGATWFRQVRRARATDATAGYARYPAPWFYLALGIAMTMLLLSLRRAPPRPRLGAAAIGVSDAPTGSYIEDKLQFTPLARGISRFLRNEATVPPMTIAISGDWGTGKSSLMQLVCEDLRNHGNRPVWFNAWHHQDEEQLLAALLAAIRDKALPGLFSLHGLQFRAHLFWLRAVKSPRISLLILFLLAALVAFFVTNEFSDWRQLAESFANLFDGRKAPEDGANARTFVSIVPQLATVVAVITAFRRALKSFGTDPAVLISSTMENFKLRDAAAQVNFRTRFQDQFDEVTTALPYPLVIVIDDLDRCRPEAMLQVMESVNFLMSSGKCFIIFGMATHRVQAALALSFKDIAQELVDLDSKTAADATAVERERAEQEKRRKYAGEYLQKLINLDIRVPSRQDIPPHLLLSYTTRDDREHWLAATRRWSASFVIPIVLAATVAGLGWVLSAQYIHLASAPQHSSPDKFTAPVPEKGPTAGPDTKVGPQGLSPQGIPAPQPPTPKVVVIEGEDSGRLSPLPIYLLAISLAAAGMVLLYRRRKEEEVVRDSDAFADALQVWTPVVARRNSAPRAIKRFGNRLRYFAMLQQAEASPSTSRRGLPFWLIRLMRRARGQQPPPSPQRVDVVAEHRIVALGAIQMVYSEDWRHRIENGFHAANDSGVGADDDLTLQNAVDAYVQRTNAQWPPSREELDAFELSLRGIRIEGEATILPAGAGRPETPSFRDYAQSTADGGKARAKKHADKPPTFRDDDDRPMVPA